MIVLLSSILLLNFIGALSINKNKEVVDSNPVDIKPTPTENITPESFKGNIFDEYNIPEGVINVIVDYMDAYYESIYTLQKQDISSLFSNEYYANMSDKAIELLVETRKVYDFDFKLSKAHYDLKIRNYSYENGIYHIAFLEDDYMCFAFLDNIESQVFDIEGYFEIKEVDGFYKIEKLYKEQGYYLGFYDYCENNDDINKMYDYYYSELKDMIRYNNEVLKERASRNTYSSKYNVSNPYNRTAAIEYANKYYHTRNLDEWYNFTEVGGNCQNYASQCMYMGGIPMDFLGEDQWKCYVDDPLYEPDLDYSETQSGRTASWVHVPSFYEYAKYNDGFGLVADVEANLYHGEPGDIVVVGNDSMAHTVIISKVVDGHILVNSNSIDMKDFPLEAYTYTYVKLIKILGSN